MRDLADAGRAVVEQPPAPPTPIDRIEQLARRRHRHRLRAGVALVTAAVLLVGAGVVALNLREPAGNAPLAPPKPPNAIPVGAPATFVSTRSGDNGDVVVAVSDARRGKALRTLLRLPFSEGWHVSGTAIAPDGEIWITLNKGPRMLGHVAGGDPQTHSCASSLVKIDPRTGKTRRVTMGGDNVLISDVQPSPDGTRIAYLESGCARFYFDNSIRIQDVATGRTLSIGSHLVACHVIANPRWSVDGRDLAFLYGASIRSQRPAMPGVCSPPRPSHLVTVPADRSQPGVIGQTAPNDPGCETNAIAVTSDGYAGIEHCGGDLFIGGPTRLVRYDRSLRPVSRSPLGTCENGASIAGDRDSAALVLSTYQFCGGNSIPGPTTKVFADTGSGPRQLLSLPGGTTAIDEIAY